MAKNTFDIHDCYVEFVEGDDGKNRPILIIDWDNARPGFVLFYKITTQYDNKPEHIKNTYYKIKDWQQAGLSQQSYIDIFKIELLEVGVLTANNGRFKGTLSQNDIIDFQTFYTERENKLK